MMADTERELKILLDREQYEMLARTLPFDSERLQINTYYDSSDQMLKRSGSALRIRNTQGKSILTIKKALDPITKYEYEREIHTDRLNLLSGEEKDWILMHEIDPDHLQPFITFTTQRKIWNLPDAELSLDLNEFGKTTDYELEYEYRKDHDGISILNSILKPYGIVYEKNCPSKLARAVHAVYDSENL